MLVSNFKLQYFLKVDPNFKPGQFPGGNKPPFPQKKSTFSSEPGQDQMQNDGPSKKRLPPNMVQCRYGDKCKNKSECPFKHDAQGGGGTFPQQQTPTISPFGGGLTNFQQPGNQNPFANQNSNMFGSTQQQNTGQQPQFGRQVSKMSQNPPAGMMGQKIDDNSEREKWICRDAISPPQNTCKQGALNCKFGHQFELMGTINIKQRVNQQNIKIHASCIHLHALIFSYSAGQMNCISALDAFTGQMTFNINPPGDVYYILSMGTSQINEDHSVIIFMKSGASTKVCFIEQTMNAIDAHNGMCDQISSDNNMNRFFTLCQFEKLIKIWQVDRQQQSIMQGQQINTGILGLNMMTQLLSMAYQQNNGLIVTTSDGMVAIDPQSGKNYQVNIQGFNQKPIFTKIECEDDFIVGIDQQGMVTLLQSRVPGQFVMIRQINAKGQQVFLKIEKSQVSKNHVLIMADQGGWTRLIVLENPGQVVLIKSFDDKNKFVIKNSMDMKAIVPQGQAVIGLNDEYGTMKIINLNI